MKCATSVLSLFPCPQTSVYESIMVNSVENIFPDLNVCIDLHKSMPTHAHIHVHTFIHEACVSSYVYTRNEIILHIVLQLALSLMLWKPYHVCTRSNA